MTPDEGLEPELTDDAVEYYFDVLTDTSVDAKIACECASTFNKNSYYIDIDFDCEEQKVKENFDLHQIQSNAASSAGAARAIRTQRNSETK